LKNFRGDSSSLIFAVDHVASGSEVIAKHRQAALRFGYCRLSFEWLVVSLMLILRKPSGAAKRARTQLRR
jgi:hypothetical protein